VTVFVPSDDFVTMFDIGLMRTGNWASALHIQVEHILGEGQRGPNWK